MGSERQVTFWSSLSKLVSCEITKYLNPDDRKIDAMNSIWSPLNHTLDFFFSSLLGKIAGKFFWASVWQKPHPLSICKTNIGSFFSSWYSIICLLTCRVDLYTLCLFWDEFHYHILCHICKEWGEAKGGSTVPLVSFLLSMKANPYSAVSRYNLNIEKYGQQRGRERTLDWETVIIFGRSDSEWAPHCLVFAKVPIRISHLVDFHSSGQKLYL